MHNLTMNFRVKRVLISVDGFILPLIVLALVTNFFIEYVITMGFIIIHELFHIIAALTSGAKLCSIRILPIGLNAQIDDSRLSKTSKVFIYMAGPCINLIFAIFIYILYACHFVSKELILGVYINMWLAFFNLLPILPLDGGKIAMELLADRFGLFRASKQIRKISVFLSIIIICIGLVLFKQSIYNVSLVLIGIYIMLCIKGIEKETAFMNIKNIIFRRSRLVTKGIFPVRVIVVMQNIKLSEVIKVIDYANMFHIVNILDQQLRIIKVMTEQEILDALMSNSMDTTLEKLLNSSKD